MTRMIIAWADTRRPNYVTDTSTSRGPSLSRSCACETRRSTKHFGPSPSDMVGVVQWCVSALTIPHRYPALAELMMSDDSGFCGWASTGNRKWLTHPVTDVQIFKHDMLIVSTYYRSFHRGPGCGLAPSLDLTLRMRARPWSCHSLLPNS